MAKGQRTDPGVLAAAYKDYRRGLGYHELSAKYGLCEACLLRNFRRWGLRGGGWTKDSGVRGKGEGRSSRNVMRYDLYLKYLLGR